MIVVTSTTDVDDLHLRGIVDSHGVRSRPFFIDRSEVEVEPSA